MEGLVHIYTGDGKGKTTAAIGLAVRGFGRGLKVLFVQFLKGSDTGELKTFEMLSSGVTLLRGGRESRKFLWNMNANEKEKLKIEQIKLFETATISIKNGEYDMVVLDEIMASITTGIIDIGAVVELIKNKDKKVEVILTGRNAPEELISMADYVSLIQPVKHPMNFGVKARIGIEY